MRFHLDEPLYDPEHALPGLLTGAQIDALEHEWGAAKINEWCAVAALTRAGDAVRHAVGANAKAPIAAVLTAAETTDSPRARRALDAYRAAASTYEEARTALADIRRRAHAAPAA